MKLSELLFKLTGKDVKEVKTGVECEYLAALGAFYKMLKGEVLEFDLGVVDRISDVYISHMLTKGCYEFVETDRIKKTAYNDRMFFCYYEGVFDVVFKSYFGNLRCICNNVFFIPTICSNITKFIPDFAI